LFAAIKEDVDARDKRGHDEEGSFASFRPRRRSRREPEPRIITLSMRIDRTRSRKNDATSHSFAPLRTLGSGSRALRSPGMTAEIGRAEY
jgi:hypothetical protein